METSNNNTLVAPDGVRVKGVRKEAIEWINNYSEDEQKTILNDLLQNGCISGMVSGLIYYSDTVKFYQRNRKEIFAMVEDFCAQTGEGLKEFLQGANNFPLDKNDLENETFVSGITGLIRKNSDSADQIKNWFSWFAFEEMARIIYSEKYEN